jgi:hypothetical protein
MHNPQSPPGTEPTSGLPTCTVTLLFTGIEGSTKQWETEPTAVEALLQSMGPVPAAENRRPYERAVTSGPCSVGGEAFQRA